MWTGRSIPLHSGRRRLGDYDNELNLPIPEIKELGTRSTGEKAISKSMAEKFLKIDQGQKFLNLSKHLRVESISDEGI